MENNITVKKASTEDKEEIFFLVESLFKELGHNTYTKEYWEDILKEVTVFKALDNGKIIGVATVSSSSAFFVPAGEFGMINELYVLPEYRSKGVGKLLIEGVKDFAREKGWRRIEVTTPEAHKWKRTVEFYKKENFAEVGFRMKLENFI